MSNRMIVYAFAVVTGLALSAVASEKRGIEFRVAVKQPLVRADAGYLETDEFTMQGTIVNHTNRPIVVLTREPNRAIRIVRAVCGGRPMRAEPATAKKIPDPPLLDAGAQKLDPGASFQFEFDALTEESNDSRATPVRELRPAKAGSCSIIYDYLLPSPDAGKRIRSNEVKFVVP